MATELPFQVIQHQFCNWIRFPEQSPPQACDIDRLRIYHDLLFNNVCSFINLVFPVTRSILTQDQWHALLVEFFQKAQCQSPFYNDISLQFREYLEQQPHPVLQEYPWLAELLQFEWLELYLDTVEMDNCVNVDKTITTTPTDNPNDTIWQLSQKVWVLVYQYPVYQWTMNMSLAEIAPQPSAILVWRNQQDQVCVEPLSPLFAILLEQLNEHPRSEQALYQLIQSTLPDSIWHDCQIQINGLKTWLITLQLLANG